MLSHSTSEPYYRDEYVTLYRGLARELTEWLAARLEDLVEWLAVADLATRETPVCTPRHQRPGTSPLSGGLSAVASGLLPSISINANERYSRA